MLIGLFISVTMNCLKLLQISAILFLCYHPAQTINYVCLRRREFIKPELNSEFISLCASAPITEFLFGNDICSQIKELQQANQLGSRLTKYKQIATRAQRARPYRQFASDNAHNRGPFLHARDQRQKKRPPRRLPTFQEEPSFRV